MLKILLVGYIVTYSISFQWLNEKRLVQATVSLLDSRAHGRDVHDSAARLLIELLRVSRDG